MSGPIQMLGLVNHGSVEETMDINRTRGIVRGRTSLIGPLIFSQSSRLPSLVVPGDLATLRLLKDLEETLDKYQEFDPTRRIACSYNSRPEIAPRQEPMRCQKQSCEWAPRCWVDSDGKHYKMNAVHLRRLGDHVAIVARSLQLRYHSIGRKICLTIRYNIYFAENSDG